MFSILDSPMAVTPPRSMALPTWGIPQVTLVTPVTSIPYFPHSLVMVRALCSIFSRSMVTKGLDMSLSKKSEAS
jgi:hypothetical protein